MIYIDLHNAVGKENIMQVFQRRDRVVPINKGKESQQHTIQESFNNGVYIGIFVEISHLPNVMCITRK